MLAKHYGVQVHVRTVLKQNLMELRLKLRATDFDKETVPMRLEKEMQEAGLWFAWWLSLHVARFAIKTSLIQGISCYYESD